VSVEKMSVSVPEAVAEAIRAAAGAAGLTVSAWMTRAAREQAELEVRLAGGRAAAHSLVVEYEAVHGPITAQTHARVEAFLDEAEAAQGSAPGSMTA
jgi:hypothetical protein